MRAYRVAYDGTTFQGFQRQPDVPTVEGALFGALAALGVYDPDEHRPEGYAAAGRTDAGVSATAQTVALPAPDWLTPRALNAELPADVRAWAAAEAPDRFHATHDAAAREYTYHLHAPAADAARARRALAALAGPHDVHNLTPDGRDTERTLATDLTVDGPYFVVTVRAGGFSRELVRRIVGLVAAVARGERAESFVDRVLSDERLSGPDGVAPAAPEPLVLTAVDYPGPDLRFRRDAEAAASAREVFEARRIERTTGARVAGLLADR
jgi:tRNA pseudouridine38-40 synthase